MNSPITQQFGLDQIPVTFDGSVGAVAGDGPGFWIGRMDPSGDVPIPTSTDDEQQNYTF